MWTTNKRLKNLIKAELFFSLVIQMNGKNRRRMKDERTHSIIWTENAQNQPRYFLHLIEKNGKQRGNKNIIKKKKNKVFIFPYSTLLSLLVSFFPVFFFQSFSNIFYYILFNINSFYNINHFSFISLFVFLSFFPFTRVPFVP